MFVYLLESEKNGKYYVGKSSNIEDRLQRHNAGYETATKPNIPYKILYYVVVETNSEATKLERWIKAKKKRASILKYFKENGVGSSHEK